MVIVNACYAGGYMEALEDPRNADPHRRGGSFGRGVEITWFGRALLAEALNHVSIGAQLARWRQELDPGPAVVFVLAVALQSADDAR